MGEGEEGGWERGEEGGGGGGFVELKFGGFGQNFGFGSAMIVKERRPFKANLLSILF